MLPRVFLVDVQVVTHQPTHFTSFVVPHEMLERVDVALRHVLDKWGYLVSNLDVLETPFPFHVAAPCACFFSLG
jgi:hypothetical protein